MTVALADIDDIATVFEKRCGRCGMMLEKRLGESNRRFADRSFCSRACSQSVQNSNWQGGKRDHPLHQTYHAMVARCHRPTDQGYADYGGRGIVVCQRWRDDFWAFVSDVGERPGGRYPSGYALYSLDRIDNDRGYEPGNVRWSTKSVQNSNQRPRRMNQAHRER